MIDLKTPEEIAIMKECGAILNKSVKELLPIIEEGITTEEIDAQAAKLIKKNGADISFNKVPGYKWATCLPINEQIVHTMPSNRKLKNGDVLTVDIGAYLKTYHTDYATTIVVGGKTTPEIEKLLKVGEETLAKAIEVAKVGNHLGHISKVIQDAVRGNGYSVMKELTGHGIGHELHEDPFVPGFLEKPIEKTYKIKNGLVIAVEIIYAMGREKIAYEADEWSIITADHSISACFEKTIAITDENTFILT